MFRRLDKEEAISEHWSMENFRRKDRFYTIAFALVDAFASLEVGAVIVINARIAESLGLAEELSGYVITAYLYPLFGVLLLALVFDRRIRSAASPGSLFLAGLALFAAGNGVCALAPGAPSFFAGRFVMSAGAALAFVGQLWTASSFFSARLMAILVWGEVGAAVGDIAGPVIGGFFAGVAPGGWRAFFLLDACVGLVTLAAAAFALGGRQAPPASPIGAAPAATDRAKRGEAVTTTLQQVAISLLLVGSEYFFSDYLQQKMDESPLPVALGNLAAAIGTIIGAAWAARMDRSFRRVPLAALFGMLCSLGALALCLSGRRVFLAALPLFASGVFMGLACVSIYASIVNASTPDGFLRCTLVYLLGMQIGNALGVQAVGIAEQLRVGPLSTASIVAVLPVAIAVFVLFCAPERGTAPGGTTQGHAKG